jgi:F-type H+-transporting ATPase subunit b
LILIERAFSAFAVLSAAGAELPPGGILAFDRATLIRGGINAFNIALLAFFLIRFLYNPVKKFMAGRTERIRNDIAAAKKTNEEAQELKSNYEKLIANINAEKEEILKEARKASGEEHDKMLFAVKEEVAEMKRRASDEIEVARKNAADGIKRQIIELSAAMAARFVSVSIDKEAQDKYIDEALSDWSD